MYESCMGLAYTIYRQTKLSIPFNFIVYVYSPYFSVTDLFLNSTTYHILFVKAISSFMSLCWTALLKLIFRETEQHNMKYSQNRETAILTLRSNSA